MTKEDFEQLKSTVKQWLFHTGSLDPTNYANDLKVKFIEPREKRIADLEATLTEQKQYTAFKCAQAKEKIEALEKEKCELLGIIQGKDKAIFVLKKENAELKERFERAKEIIKDFVDRDDSCWSIQKRAEEFLKECQ